MFEEEYIYLAGLTDTTALLAWGKFFFEDSGKVMDRGAMETIGANSFVFAQPFAEISVRNAATDEALPPLIAAGANFCLVKGLKPDTEYRYTIKVTENNNSRVWGSNQHRVYDVKNQVMRPPLPTEHRAYNNRFKTFPDPAAASRLTFLVLGDFGRADATQMRVADAMKRFIDNSADSARFIITTGDNIYSHSTGAGERDDDWFDSFYQPYRYLLNQLPVFPSMGNHDSSEQHEFNQGGEERRQVYENFYVSSRFGQDDSPVRLDWKRDSGLFYRFGFGKNVTFLCIDTSSEKRTIDGQTFSGRLCAHEKNRRFVERCFIESSQRGAKWCIPFGHHPAYSRGDSHGDTSEVQDLFDLVRGKGARVWLSGHDHNFQYLTKDRTKPAREQDKNLAPDENKIHSLLSGGGSEPRSTSPGKKSKGTLRAWGGTDLGHFLVVTIDGDQMTVQPIGENGQPLPMKDKANNNKAWTSAITIKA
jgi:hypothetical protein